MALRMSIDHRIGGGWQLPSGEVARFPEQDGPPFLSDPITQEDADILAGIPGVSIVDDAPAPAPKKGKKADAPADSPAGDPPPVVPVETPPTGPNGDGGDPPPPVAPPGDPAKTDDQGNLNEGGQKAADTPKAGSGAGATNAKGETATI